MFSVVFFCMKVEMQNRVDEIRNKKKKKKKIFAKKKEDFCSSVNLIEIYLLKYTNTLME